VLARMRERDRGAAAVEFAIVAVLLVMLVLGMIDFGIALHKRLLGDEAARAAARTLALTGNRSQAIADAQAIAGADAQVTLGSSCQPDSEPPHAATADVTVPYTSLIGVTAAITPIIAHGVMPCHG